MVTVSGGMARVRWWYEMGFPNYVWQRKPGFVFATLDDREQMATQDHAALLSRKFLRVLVCLVLLWPVAHGLVSTRPTSTRSWRALVSASGHSNIQLSRPTNRLGADRQQRNWHNCFAVTRGVSMPPWLEPHDEVVLRYTVRWRNRADNNLGGRSPPLAVS